MAGVSYPPGGLLEIVFSFDTTGSMSSILDEVRGRLQDMIQRLQSDIHGIRIGVIAHGDYCDKDVFYLDLCQNVAELCQFVKDIEGTGGGDADECFELILRTVRQNFSWTLTGSQKILVMIGDANPHEPDYERNTNNINWREELIAMKKMGIKVYGVQVFDHDGVDAFYKSLATETDGHYLKLTEFSNICDLMMAICYAERGEDFLMNYENEVRLRYGGTGIKVDNGKKLPLPKDLEGMFGTLRRDDSIKSMSSVTPVTTTSNVPPKHVKIATVKPPMEGKVRVRKHKQKAKEMDKKQTQSENFRENVSTKTFDWVSYPPGGLLEIVFSFDTTGSMSSILDEVRGRLQDMIQRLQSDIHGIRIGVIAHGDYCDKDVFYLDLCQNVAELCQFVKDIEGTGGGDADECFELILRTVRQNFSWTLTGSQKILVMIGDANPHEPDYERNTNNINWREELIAMKKMGIKVYGVQVFDHDGVDAFYKSLATETDGHYLKLTEFSNICDLMMAICYAERGEDFLMNYENEVRLRYGGTGIKVDNGKKLPLPKDLEGMFGTLRRDDSIKSMSSVTPVTTTSNVPPKHVKIATVKPPMEGKVRVRKHKQKAKEMDKKQTQSENFRENVSTKTFDCTCNCNTSTRWQMVYSNMYVHINPNLKGWKCRKLKDDTFYWKKNIAFPRLSNDQGIYELAVQTKPKTRLHVVYSFAVNSRQSQLMKTKNWENALFRSRYHRRKTMRNIINVSANNGCRVFLRRIRYSKKVDLKVKQFNYAWMHSRTRPLVKNGVSISGQTEPMETN